MTTDPPIAALLLRGFTSFDRALLDRLEARGWPRLTRAQSLVMSAIPADGTRSADIARQLGITRQAIHQTVGELIALGLVELAPDPANASAKRVVFSDAGTRNVGDALAIFAELEAELAARIGADDVTQLRHLLARAWG